DVSAHGKRRVTPGAAEAALTFARLASHFLSFAMSVNPGSIEQLRINRSGPPKSSSWPVIAGGLLLLAGGVAWVIWTTLHRPALVETAVAIATTSDAPSAVLDASGYVTARREATVSSKVTGQI